MSGPGGDEVGRVSIRVVPDTSGFRQKLQAAVEAAERDVEVTIPVKFDVDTAGLKTQLEALEKSKITIPVDIGDGTEIERLRARLQALDSSKVTIPVELDLQGEAKINAVLQRLRNRTMDLRVRMHGVNQALRELTALDAMVRRLDGRRINIHIDVDAAAAIAQIAALEAALAGIRGSLGSINSSGSNAFGGMGRSALLAIGVIALLPPLAAAIAVAGAAITAAWGAISTAVAAVGPALLLLAAPIAAVMLGMDGIKAAAKTLNPEIEKLKNLLNATFKNGFTQVFEKLRAVFPSLTAGLHDTAHALINISMRLAEMLASAAGIQRIDQIFANINRALDEMSPGIAAVVDGFLILGSQKSIFDTLTQAVNTFGQEFRSSVLNTVADGSLDAAMRGLSGTLGALSRAFTDLVENGIRLFANAAPGLNEAIDSITGFFNRFNWGSLGTSVGGVFKGLADGINSIPTATIREIEGAFADLSAEFQTADFKTAIRDLAGALPEAITLVRDLTASFDEVAGGVAGALTAYGLVSQAIKDVDTALRDTLGGFDLFGAILRAIPGVQLAPLLSDFNRWWNDAEASTTEGTARVGEAGKKGLLSSGRQFGEAAGTAAGEVPAAVEQGLVPTADAVTSGLTPAAAALAAALSQMPAVVQDGFAGLSVPVAAGMAAIATAITAGTTVMTDNMSAGFTALTLEAALGMDGLSTTITDGFTAIAPLVTAGMSGMNLAVEIGFQSMAGAATNGVLLVQTAITDGFTAIAPLVTAGMSGMNLAVEIGFQSMLSAANNGIIVVRDAITAGFTNMAPLVTAGMSGLNLAVEIGFQSMLSAANNGITVVRDAIVTGFAAIAPLVTAGMSGLNLAVEIGFQSMAGAATNGVLLVQAAITNGFLAVGASVSLAMNTLNNTLLLGFTTMQTTAANGMIGVNTAITAGFTNTNTAATTAMTLFVEAIRLGMNQAIIVVTASMLAIRTAMTTGWAEMDNAARTAMTNMTTIVRDGMTNMKTAVTTGMTEIVTSARTAMTEVQTAVRDGMTRSLAEVRNGVNAMVNALTAAIPKFKTAGANMGQALVDGLNSKLAAVRAAAARLASAAAAALKTAAGIHSPSRVFIELGELLGAGLAVGMNQSELTVKKAAESMANAAIDGASGIQDALAVDAWAADFNARVSSELGANDGDPVVRELRALRGDADQSSLLGQLVALQRESNKILAQLGIPSAAASSQAARSIAELGAF